MEIKEYIDKNLPKLNWNILPQIFEENGVELTEEIKNYLKETPGNTNWNLLKDLVEKNNKPVVTKNIAYFDSITNPGLDLDTSKSTFTTIKDVYDYCVDNYIIGESTIPNFELYYPDPYIGQGESNINEIARSINHSNNSFTWFVGDFYYTLKENKFEAFENF